MPRLFDPRFAALHYIAFGLLLFPYLNIFPVGNPTGVQIQVPAVAALMAVLVMLDRRQFVFIWLLVPILATPVVAFFWPSSMSDTARSLAIFVTIYGVWVYAHEAVLRDFPLLSVVKAMLWISALAGAVELLLGHAAFNFIIHSLSSSGRGVTALFAEPSFYGMSVALFTLVVCTFEERFRARLLYCALGVVQVGIFSQSALAILFGAGLMLLYFALVRPKLIGLGVLVVVAIMAAIAVYFVLPETSRAHQILVALATDPLGILRKDVSMGLRFSHIVLPISAAAQNFLLPHGFSAFEQFQLSIVDWWPFHLTPTSSRIMSGLGASLYEIGFLSLPLFYAVFRYTGIDQRKLWLSKRAITAIAIGLVVYYVNAISLAVPYFSIVLALMTMPARNEPEPSVN